MPRDSAWKNADGLVVGFGTRSDDNLQAVKLPGSGSEHELRFRITDMTALGTDATAGTGIYAPQYTAQAVKIPANATVQEVRVITDTAATSSGAADLLIGLYTVSAAHAVSAVDADGLAAAADSALTDFSAAGETIVLAKGSNAAYVGKKQVGTSDVIVLATYATAAYTAGAVTVNIKYTVDAP